MSTSETGYRFRQHVPVTLQRGRTQVSAIQAFTPSNADAPATSGTYTLLAPGGKVIVNAEEITPTADGAQYSVLATAIPADSTTPLGTGWQERWSLVMPDGTTRDVRRVAAMAKFELHPCVSDVDLVGMYPDLLDSLGNYRTNLGTWIDNAWSKVIRELWAHGDFPHVVVEASDVYDYVRELAFSYVFRALHKMSANTGSAEDWRELWQHHEQAAKVARQAIRITVDRDGDGLQDSLGKEQHGTSVHWNHPHSSNPRTLPRKFR